jgi:hypothetical protein
VTRKPKPKPEVPKTQRDKDEAALAHKLQMARDENTRNRRLIREMQRSIADLEGKLEIKASLRNPDKGIPKIQTRKKGSSEDNAVVCGAFSDAHCEERVTLEQTNDINEYSPEICRTRIERAFDRFVRLTDIERSGASINHAVVGLLGDFITGEIHDDLMMTNTMQQGDAIAFAYDFLVWAVDFLDTHGGFDSITFPCVDGNHGRTTKKTLCSARTDHSFETLIYQRLAERFADKPHLRFVIAKGLHVYTPIYGKLTRWTHGDSFRYGGGVGGVLVPARKKVLNWNTYKHADITVMGHWHQLGWDRDIIRNGSIIGPNPFGMTVGARERAQQAFWIVTERQGFAGMKPIFVDSQQKDN